MNVKAVFDPRGFRYHPKWEGIHHYPLFPHFFASAGVERIHQSMQLQPFIEFAKVREFPRTMLYTIHSPEYVKWLLNLSKTIPDGTSRFPLVMGHDLCYDTLTPLTRESFEAAWSATRIAWTGARLLIQEEESLVYGLTFPSGNHCLQGFCGGSSFLNHAALAAEYFLKEGALNVAVLDLDLHHGNGTQEIFYEMPEVLTISIHGDPQTVFPWVSGFEWEKGEEEGKGYNINLPLEQGATFKDYSWALDMAIQQLEDFDPEFLIISMAFNTHADSPYQWFQLRNDDFRLMGRSIRSLEVPTLIVQEDGSDFEQLGIASSMFVRGLEGY